MPPNTRSKTPHFSARARSLLACLGLLAVPGLWAAGGASATETEPEQTRWAGSLTTELSLPSIPPFEIGGLPIDLAPIELRLEPASLTTVPSPSASAQTADRRSRPRGLAFVDLPGRIRARFDATYTTNLYSSDDLAEPFLTTSGPELRDAHSLESRVALSRPVGRHVELEIAWGGRSRIEHADLLDFDRQTVGAMIRIAP